MDLLTTQSVWGEGIAGKVNGHTLKHGHAFGKHLSGHNSLEKSFQEGALEVWKTTKQTPKYH